MTRIPQENINGAEKQLKIYYYRYEKNFERISHICTCLSTWHPSSIFTYFIYKLLEKLLIKHYDLSLKVSLKMLLNAKFIAL